MLAVPCLLAGAMIVMVTVLSAVLTVVVPRGTPVLLTRWVFVAVRAVFSLLGRRARSYQQRDQAMAMYAPVSLLTLALAWLTLELAGYMLIFWSLGERPWRLAFALSGSSLLTLGFTPPGDLPKTALCFSEGVLGLTLLALLIAYLPAIYASFSRREALVAALDVRAGLPPTAAEMLERMSRIKGLDHMEVFWRRWEEWFMDIEETHTTNPALVFFRSPVWQRSWITAAGAVLDAAAISASTVEGPRQTDAELCIRAGYLSLRRIADYFAISYEADPKPDDPISIARQEYDQVCDRLALAGVPLRADRDQAWRDFAGWRVNYDTVLLALAALAMAPYAPWSSDRSRRLRRPPMTRRAARSRV
ncbi:MAG TPA: hypothetical protein VFA45_05540 [Actinomycetes bacterium]|nr:hypothetical protein [Actinomycetes bacterium]